MLLAISINIVPTISGTSETSDEWKEKKTRMRWAGVRVKLLGLTNGLENQFCCRRITNSFPFVVSSVFKRHNKRYELTLVLRQEMLANKCVTFGRLMVFFFVFTDNERNWSTLCEFTYIVENLRDFVCISVRMPWSNQLGLGLGDFLWRFLTYCRDKADEQCWVEGKFSVRAPGEGYCFWMTRMLSIFPSTRAIYWLALYFYRWTSGNKSQGN